MLERTVGGRLINATRTDCRPGYRFCVIIMSIVLLDGSLLCFQVFSGFSSFPPSKKSTVLIPLGFSEWRATLSRCHFYFSFNCGSWYRKVGVICQSKRPTPKYVLTHCDISSFKMPSKLKRQGYEPPDIALILFLIREDFRGQYKNFFAHN